LVFLLIEYLFLQVNIISEKFMLLILKVHFSQSFSFPFPDKMRD